MGGVRGGLAAGVVPGMYVSMMRVCVYVGLGGLAFVFLLRSIAL